MKVYSKNKKILQLLLGYFALTSPTMVIFIIILSKLLHSFNELIV